MMSRREGPPRKRVEEADADYTVEALVEDIRQVAALSAALAAGTADEKVLKRWENYRREYGAESSVTEFAALTHMRSKYGEGGFRRFVRFDVVTDTLAAYRSEMVRLGVIASEGSDQSEVVRARVPVEVLERLLSAPILETPGGMTLGKEAVSRILQDVARSRKG